MRSSSTDFTSFLPIRSAGYARLAAAALLLAVIMAGCSDGGPSSPGQVTEPDPVPRGPDPIEVALSPLEAVNYNVFSPRLRVSGGVGLDSVRVSDGLGLDSTFVGFGDSLDERLGVLYEFPRDSLPVGLEYSVSVFDRDTTVSKSFDVSVLEQVDESFSFDLSPKDVDLGDVLSSGYSPVVRVESESFPLDRVSISGPGWDRVYDLGGDSFSFEGSKSVDLSGFGRSDLPAVLGFDVGVWNSVSDSSGVSFDVVLDYVNEGPVVEDVSYDNRVVERDQSIGFEVSDDWGLERVVLSVEGQVYEKGVSGLVASGGFSHDFVGSGVVPFSVEVFDDEGLSGVYESEVLVDLWDLDVEARGFFGKGPNVFASLELENLDSGAGYVLEADGSGLISGVDLEGGLYRVRMRGGSDLSDDWSEFNRFRVEPGFFGDPYMFWHGEDFSFVSSGYEDTPFLLDLGGDVSSVLETVEDLVNPMSGGRFVDEASRLVFPNVNNLAVPMPAVGEGGVVDRRVTRIVLNEGNDAYGRGWNVRDYNQVITNPSGYPDGGVNPPGGVFSDEQIGNFDIFVEDLFEVFENDVVGQNPYTIEVIKDSAENLHDLVDRWSYNESNTGGNTFLAPAEDVLFVGRTSAGGIEVGGPTYGYYRSIAPENRVKSNHALRTYMFVGGNSPIWFSNELRHFGTWSEANPSVCSVKDDESIPFSEQPCGTIFNERDPPEGTGGRSLKEFDRRFLEFSTGFGPYAQVQLSKNYVEGLEVGGVGDDVWVPSDQFGFDGLDRNHFRIGNVYFPENEWFPDYSSFPDHRVNQNKVNSSSVSIQRDGLDIDIQYKITN